jgi:uncharacterized membrane protein YvbJ
MSKFCPFCGEELIDSAKFCKSCGKNLDEFVQRNPSQDQEFTVPTVEKSHTALIVIGFICGVLIPLIGVIISVYLMTRNDSPNAKKYGKYILIVSVIVWILSIISIFR